MDIQSFNSWFNEELCNDLIIYHGVNPKKNIVRVMGQTLDCTAEKPEFLDVLYKSDIKKLYKNPILDYRNRVINHLRIIKIDQFQGIHGWTFFDQINSKPSTLTFIAKISKSQTPIQLEFIKDGKFELDYRSIIFFPSCFSYSFRINPIYEENEYICLGSLLYNKI